MFVVLFICVCMFQLYNYNECHAMKCSLCHNLNPLVLYDKTSFITQLNDKHKAKTILLRFYLKL